MLRILASAALLIVLLSPSLAKDPTFTVHEWGTFTVLQDEQGREIAGINTDDEPVPKFVHDVAPGILAAPVLSDIHWQYRMKGAPRHHPAVTMRLETPVIYFHRTPGLKFPPKVNVQVSFRGGWLTQFYPRAEFSAPGAVPGRFDFRLLTRDTVGKLTWSELQVGADGVGPETDDPVWLHPRKVDAANVTALNGESEKYLFYRGVAQQRAPLRVSLDREKKQLSIRGNFGETLKSGGEAELNDLWLTSVSRDGVCRYRRLEPMTVDAREDIVRMSAGYTFAAEDSTTDQKVELTAEMHAALTKDGLNSDEATALLSTWQRAYFATPGLRLFYLVPRAWTDHILPLTITGDPPLVRSMVGRIELIGDDLRERLTKLTKTPNSTPQWLEKIPESPQKEAFFAGRSYFGDLGVEIPADYKLYLSLGRFRNALVTSEEARTKSVMLQKFVDNYGLHPFRVSAATKGEGE